MIDWEFVRPRVRSVWERRITNSWSISAGFRWRGSDKRVRNWFGATIPLIVHYENDVIAWRLAGCPGSVTPAVSCDGDSHSYWISDDR